MAFIPTNSRQVSRRDLLRHISFASASLAIAPILPVFPAFASSNRASEAEWSFTDSRYVPHYPVRSPLDDVLRLVAPGVDDFQTELYAAEIGVQLDGWSIGFKTGDFSTLARSLDAAARLHSMQPSVNTEVRSESGIHSFRCQFASHEVIGKERFVQEVEQWIGKGVQTEHALFEVTSLGVTSLEEGGQTPLTLRSVVQFSLVTERPDARREQRVGTWEMDWVRKGAPGEIGHWQVSRFEPKSETRSDAPKDAFVDVTQQALGATESYAAQLLHGVDDWRTRLDGACGIDVYGNNGIAAGDFTNDGFDDLYVCQPAGLPNRLYRNRGDGTFEDVTERAGVGVLDNTACALFADFRNTGWQDLLVVCGSGPLLFLNQRDGTFALKRDAFQFARPPQGTFTHAAIADYDHDGRLDVYFCLYSYYLGLDQYHYPAPYFDARNGPPNFLFHNEGDATFVDRTEAAGLNADNDRYSFACAWGETGGNKLPDLYVVNDFGRNTFYRSNGDGTFRSAAHEAHVEDVGAGMSASWGDAGNRGHSDLYVANMWSAAGQRISQQPNFHANAPEPIRELYRRHASGNALYRNGGHGTFTNVSEDAGVAMGRWAWGSDFWDFDHDGFADLYITNGYITASEATPLGASSPGLAGTRKADLASFFWRQVVGRSPEDATPSLAYERGWNALNELIRTDASWSGQERNVALANNHDGTFSDASGALGLDFLEDGRSFALADLDGDGRLELVVKNRNAPQLRIVRNNLPELGDSIVFRLRGVQSNRDALGASITLTAGPWWQTRFVQAGTGFLAQHSKELHFGIGKGTEPMEATVRWPSGQVQHFTQLPRNHRIQMEEGSASFTAMPFRVMSAAYGKAKTSSDSRTIQPSAAAIETWLIDPLPAPMFALPDFAGSMHALESSRGKLVLLHFWSTRSPKFRENLRAFEQHHKEFSTEELDVFAINVDHADAISDVRSAVGNQRLSFPVLVATEEAAGIYNIIYRYLFDRRANLALPTSFLLDRTGMIVKLYQGPVQIENLLQDLRSLAATPAERRRRALPFPGTLFQGEFVRDDFTYGVAMFQHGYLDQAAVSFQQVVAARPNDAEAHYNLGTLSLRRNNFAEARRFLERTLQLKPSYPEAWNNLGMMAAQEGHPEEAIEDFQKSLALRPTYATALLNLGNVYRRQQDFVHAQEALTSALRLQPNDPEAHYSFGMLLAQQNQLPEAATSLRKAILLRPDYPEALNNLGVVLVREQIYDDAEKQFALCIRLDPQFDQSYVNLARLYLAQRQPAKARITLHELLRVKPDSTAARQGLAALGETP